MRCFFFSSRRRHTRWTGDWSSDVCSSDLTGNAWANPATSETPRRLVLEGGFAVHGGRDWLLRDGARALGFRDLRGCLQARCDGGYSIPRIATELGVRDWHVQAAGAV